MASIDIPVLIIGGGSVGLSAAVLLAHRGVSAMVVERHAGIAIHPRAIGFGVRAMEIFRGIGLEERVGTAAAPLANKGGWVSVETLASANLSERAAESPASTAQGGEDPFSPTTGIACSQDALDALLCEAALQYGVTMRFNSEVIALDQDTEGVNVTLTERATGEQSTVRAAYVVAADGATSFVRRTLGIATSGPGDLGVSLINTLFEADLGPFVGEHPFTLCTVRTPRAPGMFIRIRYNDRWVFHCTYDPARGERPEDFTPERCRELIRAAVGVPDLAVEIVSILPWQVAALLAERFQEGRVFLVGDAAHAVPPTGGFGMSSGIADAHNLAWKLALVLSNHANPALLDTYQSERHPAAQFTMDQAFLRLQNPQIHFDPDHRDERVSVGIANPDVVHLGYRYSGAAIVASGAALPSLEDLALDLDGSPGTRLPHVWVERRSERVSTLDFVDGHFTLFAGPQGDTWCAAAKAAGSRLGLEVSTYLLGPGGDISVPMDVWQSAMGIDTEGALLVRPDGFVAWRATSSERDPDAILEHVLRRMLGDAECP